MLAAVALLQLAVSASAQTLVGITNHNWQYFTTAGGPSADWATVGFDDSTWLTGRGLFGNDTGYPYPFPAESQFPGPGGGGPVVAFFRTHFNWVGSTDGVVFTMTNYFDDGVVIYLNGVELTRNNMPAGLADYSTFALGTRAEGVPVVHQAALSGLTNLSPNPLVAGDNVLAASVHNNATGSSDTVFGLSVVATQVVAPCTDGIQPTNRIIFVGRSTTFTVVEQCAVPAATIQWFRNVGAGEEQIIDPVTTLPVTGASYTKSNAAAADAGVYYARLTNLGGSVDSRQATLTVNADIVPPRFLLAQVVGPGFNTFRLTTDEELCGDADPLSPTFCGSDFEFQFNWQVLQSDNLAVDLGVASITMITPTIYEFTTSNPRDPSKQYRITVLQDFGDIGDLFQNKVPTGTFAETGIALSFQQGDANGYSGAQDTELHSNATADTVQGAAAAVTIDNDDAGIAHGLLRFDNIFGSGANLIPPGSVIISATLTLNQTDQGSAANFHRMLVTWDQTTATWNSMVDGVANDGVEAVVASDALSTAEPFPNGPMLIDVTASLRAWSAGQANFGWGIRSTGTGGWDWNTSESGAGTAPLLTVEYQTVPCTTPPTITQQPPATTVPEGTTITVQAGVNGDCEATYQWSRNGTDVPGLTSKVLSIPNARPSAHNGDYRLRVTNPNGTVTSAPATVTVTPDTAGPRVTRVVSSVNGTTITVQFDETVSTASAQSTANYTLTPPVTVSSAVLGANNTVTLTTAARSVGTSYSLRIASVTDVAETPNPINPNPTIIALTSASIVTGAEFGSTWLYNSNNLDSTAGAWKDVGFVPDGTWGSGPASFGIETSAAVLGAAPAPINTPLSANSVAPGDALTTTYFRKDITLPALPAGARYVMCHFTDDGHITYLDGVEINRYSMPAGAVTFTNRSTGIANGGEASYRSFAFTATPGAHVLAVELHQSGATSSDVFFAMEVRIVSGAAPSLSISRAGNGDINLSWPGDASWQLRNSATVDGLYNNTAIPAGTSQGRLTIPAAAADTGNNFYQLHYICLP